MQTPTGRRKEIRNDDQKPLEDRLLLLEELQHLLVEVEKLSEDGLLLQDGLNNCWGNHFNCWKCVHIFWEKRKNYWGWTNIFQENTLTIGSASTSFGKRGKTFGGDSPKKMKIVENESINNPSQYNFSNKSFMG